MRVWNYLMLLGYGARDVIMAGDSAGGNLALSLVLKLKQENRLLPRGLCLMSPWTDLTASGRSHETRQDIDPVFHRFVSSLKRRHLEYMPHPLKNIYFRRDILLYHLFMQHRRII